jgi:hypothetical protein
MGSSNNTSLDLEQATDDQHVRRASLKSEATRAVPGLPPPTRTSFGRSHVEPELATQRSVELPSRKEMGSPFGPVALGNGASVAKGNVGREASVSSPFNKSTEHRG